MELLGRTLYSLVVIFGDFYTTEDLYKYQCGIGKHYHDTIGNNIYSDIVDILHIFNKSIRDRIIWTT